MSIVSNWQSLSKNEKEGEVQMGLANLKVEDVKTQEHGNALCIGVFIYLCLLILLK